MTKKILPLLLPLLMTAHAVQAEMKLIAIGQVDGNYQDLSRRTAAPLENGVPGNILGGVGSALAYAGRTTFIALPDRGPNATAYNGSATIDDTTSYINRFQTFDLSLAGNPNYPTTVGSTPFILTPQLTATTLLSSPTALSYGVGGAPKLNTATKFYYTGRSDGFNATGKSTSPTHARLDPEGIRVSNDGKSVFISDEYGPYVYQFNRINGSLIKAFTLPDRFAVSALRSVEKGTNGELAVNTSGRTTNKGMEGLAITPDGKTLVGIMQASLIQDTSKYIRIVTINIDPTSADLGKTKEYAYQLTDGSGASEILAINNHEFLVDERDGKGLGDGSAAVVKKLFKIDLSGATDISAVDSIGATTPVVGKTLVLDLVAKLTASGIDATKIPAKIEGISFGPDVRIAGKINHTLFIANDNDFLSSVNGIENPNKFYVFSFDDIDLPNFVKQPVAPLLIDKHDRG